MRAGANVVVVTGLSGAGKTTALHAMADVGYYCVDNLPPALAAATVRVCSSSGIDLVALGMDIRVGAFLDTAREAIEALQHHPAGVLVLYLDAADDVLVRRFSETRRPHPMLAASDSAAGGRALAVADGVRLERDRLLPIRNLASVVVDSTHMSVHELRRQIVGQFSPRGAAAPRMQVHFVSFGYKHGVPLDADLVFDVRFLDNPHFVAELRDLTGNDEAVRGFVLDSPGTGELIDHLVGLLAFSMPRYHDEGKSYLTIAIGCTGGRHRSVTIVNELAQRLARSQQRRFAIVHRDIAKGAMMTEESGSSFQGTEQDEHETRSSRPGEIDGRPRRIERGGDAEAEEDVS